MSICTRCQKTFTCAMADLTGQDCWCEQLPKEMELPIYPELAVDGKPSCFCPQCMHEWQQRNHSSIPQN